MSRVEAVERVDPLERASRVGEPEDESFRRAAGAGGERQAVRDVAVRVAAGRAKRVEAERDRRGQSFKAAPASSHDPGAGVRLEFPGRRFHELVERFGPALRVPDRDADGDLVDGRADLARELGVEQLGFGESLVLFGADQLRSAMLVVDRGGQPLPPPSLAGAYLRAAADADVHRDGDRQRG